MIKKVFGLLALVAFLASFSACSETKVENTSADTEATIIERVVDGDENATVAYMSIEGMSCEVGCARFINKKLAKTEGVLASEINFEENLAKVSFDPNKVSARDLASMVNQLNDGQYKVVSVEVEQTRKAEGGDAAPEPVSKSKASDNELEQVGYRSISFPNILNLFKIKFI